MKQLVTATTIEQFVASHKDVFPVTNDTLITPSAADLAKTKGIRFVAEAGVNAVDSDNVMATKQTSDHADSIAAGAHHQDAPAPEAASTAETAPEEPVATAAEPSVANFSKEQIVEAVIRVLDAKGILDKILDE